MDIFQYFLSHHDENVSAFSDVFRTAKEFHQLLGRKSYLLDHYLSMLFRLITEMDFCILEDKIYQTISELQKKMLPTPFLCLIVRSLPPSRNFAGLHWQIRCWNRHSLTFSSKIL